MSGHSEKPQYRWLFIGMTPNEEINPPASSPSGNVHGMPLACCIGLGPPELVNIGGPAPQVQPGSVALVGLRSIDDAERFNVPGAGVHPFTMRAIAQRGLPAALLQASGIVTAGPTAFHPPVYLDAG